MNTKVNVAKIKYEADRAYNKADDMHLLASVKGGVCWGLDTSTSRLNETGYGYWGGVIRSMVKDMSPGCRRAPIVNTRFGARRNSLLCKVLTATGCWPTVLCVELLMGWPIGWTALRPLATDRFRTWRRSRGMC